MHPAEVTNEIKDYTFFKNFKMPTLLQISTMMETQTFSQGECLLVEGQGNHKLYFLRSGAVELYVGGRKIAVLADQGEVMGEMSVITGHVASTTIVAETSVETFVLDVHHFNEMPLADKQDLELLLYKVYCTILVDRLTRANARQL